MATSADLINHYYHPHEMLAYTINDKRDYLEHDWTTTADSSVYEIPGEGHALVTHKHEQPMCVFFIVKRLLVWPDKKGNTGGIFGVHDYVVMCHARYDEVGVGAAYIDSLFR